MKDRIKQIMDSEDMTSAQFADSLQIGRAVISHILNGRNNPSLDVVTRILTELPQINADWLLSGIGDMYKNHNNEKSFFSEGSSNTLQNSPQISERNNRRDIFQQDLFAQNQTESTNLSDDIKYDKEKELTSSANSIQNTVNEVIKYVERPQKRISKIIIYYDDNTFETFNPEK